MALGWWSARCDHNRSAHTRWISLRVTAGTPTSRGSPCHETEDAAALMDSLIARVLRGYSNFMPRPTCSNESPWDTTADELRETARRIVGIKRQFNLMAGWTLDEDTLPERFLNTPLPSDPTAALSREQLGVLVAEYHRQREW